MDAAVRRSDVTGVSIRPSWVQWEGNYSRNLSPALRDPEHAPSASFWRLERGETCVQRGRDLTG
ncbi:MAG: hypothetical protein ACRDK0_06310 [Solirubrobacteraceae bacterium]